MMTETTDRKWRVVMAMTTPNNVRQEREVVVFAEDRGEARATARQVFEDDGNEAIILKYSEELR